MICDCRSCGKKDVFTDVGDFACPICGSGRLKPKRGSEAASDDEMDLDEDRCGELFFLGAFLLCDGWLVDLL